MTAEERFAANEKLVYFSFHRYMSGRGLDNHTEDIIQEGMLGLWLACTRFDESLGNEFDTFAVHYIAGYMKKYCMKKVSLVHIPREAWSLEELHRIAPTSLDETVDDAGKTALSDLIADKETEYLGLTTELIEQFLTRYHERLCKKCKLPETVERNYNMCRDYLYEATLGKAPTYQTLADRYGISREYVRQLLNNMRDDFKWFIK